VVLSDLKREGEQLTFTVEEITLPSPPPPTSEGIPAQLSSQRDQLVATGLKPGNYTLIIDGVEVTTATHQDWARGVALDSSPAHRDAEILRAAVNDKNLQFTYSWKALNQVHIVGERKSSPSGRALPAEVIEFNRLANERDKDLRKSTILKTRQWKLALTNK